MRELKVHAERIPSSHLHCVRHMSRKVCVSCSAVYLLCSAINNSCRYCILMKNLDSEHGTSTYGFLESTTFYLHESKECIRCAYTTSEIRMPSRLFSSVFSFPFSDSAGSRHATNRHLFGTNQLNDC